MCRGLFIHSNVVLLVLYCCLQGFSKQTAEANTPFTNKYDTCLWTRLSGFPSFAVQKASSRLCGLTQRCNTLEYWFQSGHTCIHTLAVHNIILPPACYIWQWLTFPIPTVTLHCSGCSALWLCLCIRKLIVGCTQVHMWHLTLGITSLVPSPPPTLFFGLSLV